MNDFRCPKPEHGAGSRWQQIPDFIGFVAALDGLHCAIFHGLLAERFCIARSRAGLSGGSTPPTRSDLHAFRR
jgi:hypothetical protein